MTDKEYNKIRRERFKLIDKHKRQRFNPRQKSTNQFRHRWIDKGIEKDGMPIYIYYCSKCGKGRIKTDFCSMTYYDENGNSLGSKAPECVKSKKI